eukprot:Sdes_comp20202_c0_seq2m13517
MRPAAGIRNTTIIINFPGSKKAVSECLSFLSDIIPHALLLLRVDPVAAASVQNLHDSSCNLRPFQSVPLPQKASCPSFDACTIRQCKSFPSPTINSSQTQLGFSAHQSVADRPRTSQFSMVTMKQALQIIERNAVLMPITQTTVFSTNLMGAILSEDVTAKINVPPYRSSAKDGYAVISSEGPGEYQVVGSSIAGCSANATLLPGQVIRISTGAALPLGADAVVQVEDTQLLERSADGMEESRIRIHVSVIAGQDVREIGSDIKKGEVILKSRTEISPSELGILTCSAVKNVSVFAKPKIAVFSTGDEILSFSSYENENAILDSN